VAGRNDVTNGVMRVPTQTDNGTVKNGVYYSNRSDPFLALGVAIVGYVLLSRPTAALFEWLSTVPEIHDLRLMPAAIIAATVFGLYQWRQRRQLSGVAIGAAIASKEAVERAEETSRLVNFAHALTRIPEFKSVAAAAATHVPLLVPNRRAWVMIRTAGVWEPLMTVGDTPPIERERAARRAMGEGGLQVNLPTDDECFPVVIADTPVCVLGIASEPALTVHQRSVLTTAAALLAASLKNSELMQELHENGLQDGLTGCFNRTHAIDSLDIELKRARRTKRPLSVLMFDLDSFKLINDRHGHLCGDAVLAAVGDRMRGATRAGDLKCRYGGDEFIVILPETPLAGAKLVSENLRKAIEKDPIPWAEGLIALTASFGVTETNPGEVDPLAVIARADSALYRAKRSGRNRVAVAEEVPAL
jgi:diguanylate cyclase (GGDEF)-like protein